MSKKLKIFLDPGHGGHDPGAVGTKSKEAENVLKVALALEKKLKAQGHEVKLSRRTDTYLTLKQRADLANAWGADVFISLHDNSAVTKIATGFETFIFNGNVSEDSIKLQQHVHNTIASGIGLRDRGMKRANFAVLRLTSMPAVLIEYGFISNLMDEKIIAFEIGKQVQLTFEGFNNYFGVKSISSITNPKTIESTKKEARKLDINSPSLNDIVNAILESKGQREIIINYAIAEGAHKSWHDKLNDRTITNDEILALAAMSIVNVNK